MLYSILVYKNGNLYISIRYIYAIMELLHIRVGPEIKKQMQSLIDKGLFSNQAEIAREGIRYILLRYKQNKTK